ncbi:MAG: aminotransferase class [Frankiales bacterium]|nr:aminotransferase class [Frankiales bacterium]
MPAPTRFRKVAARITPTQRYLTFGLIVAALYFEFPAYHLELWTPLGLSSVVATVVGIRRHRPRQIVAWYLLAAAEFFFIAGDTTYTIARVVLHEPNPFPSLADVFYLLTYPCFAAGLLLFIRARSAGRDRADLIDALIVTAGLALLSWVYLVIPNFQAEGLSALQRLISVGYPLGDVLVVAMLVRLIGGGGLRQRSMQFLVLGAIGLLVSDVLYGLIQLNGDWHENGPVDIGWLLFYLAWGCAGLQPSMAGLSDIVPRRNQRMGGWRVAALTLVSLIAPAILFIESTSQSTVEATTIAVFSAALFLLVIARLWILLEVHKQSIRRERILRASSEALVAAQGLAEIYQVAVDGALALISGPASTHASIYLIQGDDDPTCVAHSGAQPSARRPEQLRQMAESGGRLTASGTVSVTPIRYDSQDRGMLVVDSAVAMTLEQHDVLAILAAQVALAVASAQLGADLRQRQGEARFRGILQNASDIVVIVDVRGQITYSTPSLARNLGRHDDEVLGHELAEFLHEADAAQALTMFSEFGVRAEPAEAVADWHLRHRDGRLMAFEVLSNNLLADPHVSGIVLTMRDVSERRALEVELKHQAFHDSVTGLPNRALFQDRAEHALARVARIGTIVAMLMLDLDDFKNINDTRGHAAGDELLQELASRLQKMVRSGATVSRFGGDEFAILVEDLTEVSQAERFAERALDLFAAPFTIQGEAVTVRASIGLVVTGGVYDWFDMTELMRCADVALYAAKGRGKQQVVLYHSDLNTLMLDRLNGRSDLERAIKAEEFVLHFQPIVLVDTGAPVGCEALVRWQHPSRGLVPPLDFIELAEETGLIVDIGRWVLEQACAQLRAWADAGLPPVRMAVNVSARQLRESTFVDDLRAALGRYDISKDQLVLELTESLFALDSPEISAQLRGLRELGIKIAMDDFGTGYSSLAYLQKLQLDILKIDKSFVDGLGNGDADGSTLVEAIISLSASLHLEVVAEGIERVAQRDELRAMGCRLGQGYLFSRPVDSDAMTAVLVSASIGRSQPLVGR